MNRHLNFYIAGGANVLHDRAKDTQRDFLLTDQNAIIRTVTDLMGFVDGSTGGHGARTRVYFKLLACAMAREGIFQEEMAGWDVDLIARAAQLHDVGKIAIDHQILRKPASLTEDEFGEMKEHVQLGVDLINRLERSAKGNVSLHWAKSIAATHHERWDGSGYPYGLRGRTIPLEGRIMAIADVYDALTSERSYKRAYDEKTAVEIILNGAGTHFDPQLVQVFHWLAARFAMISSHSAGEGKDGARLAS